MFRANLIFFPTIKLFLLFLLFLFIKLVACELNLNKFLFPSHIKFSFFILSFMNSGIILLLLLLFNIFDYFFFIMIDLPKIFIYFLVFAHKFLNTIDPIIVHQHTIIGTSCVLVAYLIGLPFHL